MIDCSVPDVVVCIRGTYVLSVLQSLFTDDLPQSLTRPHMHMSMPEYPVTELSGIQPEVKVGRCIVSAVFVCQNTK